MENFPTPYSLSNCSEEKWQFTPFGGGPKPDCSNSVRAGIIESHNSFVLRPKNNLLKTKMSNQFWCNLTWPRAHSWEVLWYCCHAMLGHLKEVRTTVVSPAQTQTVHIRHKPTWNHSLSEHTLKKAHVKVFTRASLNKNDLHGAPISDTHH